MAPEVGRARIYLSFADEDRPRLMELVRWLNDGGWQVRADDRHAFPAGDDWGRAAAKRLNGCDVILCVITPGWLVSTYCHREYSYCAKRGKFVLPLLWELADVDLLPEPMRALPRVDLTGRRMVDYLALKEVLVQAGTRTGDPGAGPKSVFGSRRWLLPTLCALLLGAAAGAWFLLRG
jgi:TIR domain